MPHICVLGSGAWGMALASKLSENAPSVMVWGRNAETVKQINLHLHPNHPSTTFAHNIKATTSLSVALNGAEAVLLCVPSSAFCDVLSSIARDSLSSFSYFSWATKGFSPQGDLFSEVIKKQLDVEGAFVTGPTFADEAVKNRPTAVLIAGNQEQTEFWNNAFHTKDFRPYTSQDVRGAQVGAALKNIIAIAVGVCDGLGFGSNAQAAVITRGLKEISQLSAFFGGQTETLYGLSGLGDVVLTSTSNLSRNRCYGLMLAQEKPFDGLVEGKKAVGIVKKIIDIAQIELPICEAVYEITHMNMRPLEVAEKLLRRELKPE